LNHRGIDPEVYEQSALDIALDDGQPHAENRADFTGEAKAQTASRKRSPPARRLR
jgi:hypothetical protein